MIMFRAFLPPALLLATLTAYLANPALAHDDLILAKMNVAAAEQPVGGDAGQTDKQIFYMFMDREKGDRPVDAIPALPKPLLIPVAERIYMIQANSGNIGVCIGDDGVLLIDDGFPTMNEALLEAIAEITDQPITMVLNTHWHWDHTGGNANMAKQDAMILSHEKAVQWMTTWQVSGMSGTPKPPQKPLGVPRITFSDELTVRMNGYTIRMREVGPAHTSGDAIVHFEEANVYQVGDIFLPGNYPWIDLNTGGDWNGLIEALDDVLDGIDPDAVIMPGHNEVSNVADMRLYRNMVVTIRDRVQAAIDEGKSSDEILAMNLLSDLDEKWANPLITSQLMVYIVHASLTGQGTKAAQLDNIAK